MENGDEFGLESNDEFIKEDENYALLFESVWLNQLHFEESEASAHQRKHPGHKKKTDKKNHKIVEANPLSEETVWFAQTQYEKMEAEYFMKIDGVETDVKPKVQHWKNYEENLERMMSKLQDTHSTLNDHVRELQKHRKMTINGLRDYMVLMSDMVQKAVERFGCEVSQCDYHIVAIQGFLGMLQSTLDAVKKESEAIKTSKSNKGAKGIQSKSHTHKSLFSSLKTVDYELYPWLDEACKMKIRPLDDIPEMIENIKQLKFVENIDIMGKFKKKYPKMQSDLQKINNSLSVKKNETTKRPAVAAEKKDVKVKVKNGIVKKNENSNTVKPSGSDVDDESLDGSLGDECCDDDVTLLHVNAVSHNDGAKKISVDGQKKKTARGDKSNDEKNSKNKKIKMPLAQAKPSGEDSNAKVTNPNKKEKSNASIQQKEKGPKSANSATTPKSKKKQEKKPWQPYHHQNVALCPLPNEELVSNMQCGANPFPQYPGMSVRHRQQFKDHNQYKQYVQRQLTETGQKIRQMCLYNGPSLELQEMLTETELLLQMIHHNLMPDQFPHRYALLMMAFNYQQEMLVKPEQVEAAIPQQSVFYQGPANFNVPNGNLVNPRPRNPTRPEKRKPRNNPPLEPMAAAKESATPMLPKQMRKFFPHGSSLVHKIASINPGGQLDKNRAGISSVVALDEYAFLVLVDIINSCLKLYDTGSIHNDGNCTFVSLLKLQQPYYMTNFGVDKVLVSRAGRILSVIQVSRINNPLVICEHIECSSQYYGLGWVKDDVFAGACYDGNRIDLIRVRKGHVDVLSILSSDCYGPELLAVIPYSHVIVYLERIPGQGMHLTGVNRKRHKLFQVSLGGSDSDVWNLACVEEKIVCCSKHTNRILLFSKTGRKIASLLMPLGTVTMPFAIGFSSYGQLYLANDAAWEEDNHHYVTTEINVFAFSTPSD